MITAEGDFVEVVDWSNRVLHSSCFRFSDNQYVLVNKGHSAELIDAKTEEIATIRKAPHGSFIAFTGTLTIPGTEKDYIMVMTTDGTFSILDWDGKVFREISEMKKDGILNESQILRCSTIEWLRFARGSNLALLFLPLDLYRVLLIRIHWVSAKERTEIDMSQLFLSRARGKIQIMRTNLNRCKGWDFESGLLQGDIMGIEVMRATRYLTLLVLVNKKPRNLLAAFKLEWKPEARQINRRDQLFGDIEVASLISLYDEISSLLAKDQYRSIWVVGSISWTRVNPPKFDIQMKWEIEGIANCSALIEESRFLVGTTQSKIYFADLKTNIWFKVEMDGPSTLPYNMCLIRRPSEDVKALVFIGSRHGNSLLASMESQRFATTKVVIDNSSPWHHLQAYKDLSGEAQLLLCSGRSPVGTVRKGKLALGVNSVSLAASSVPENMKLISIKEKNIHEYHSYLAMSFLTHPSTQLFKIDSGVFSPLEIDEFNHEATSVLISTLDDDQWLQVTTEEVRLICRRDSRHVKWIPSRFISKSACSGRLMSVCHDQTIVLLRLDFQEISIVEETCLPQQISAMDFVKISEKDFLFVGEWMSNAVKILDTNKLATIAKISLGDLQPRSIAGIRFGKADTSIVVGTSVGDIVLLRAEYDLTHHTISLRGDLGKAQIGRTDVTFIQLQQGRLLACADECAILEMTDAKHDTENPTVHRLFLGRHICDSITDMNLYALPDGIAWTNSVRELYFGRLDYKERIRWSTLEIGETPVLSLYHEKSMTVIAVTEEEDNNVWKLHLIDSKSFQLLATASLPDGYTVNDIIQLEIPELDSSISPTSYIVISINAIDPESGESKQALSVFRIESVSEDSRETKELHLVGLIPLSFPAFTLSVACPEFLKSNSERNQKIDYILLDMKNRRQGNRGVNWRERWPVLIIGSEDYVGALCLALTADDSMTTLDEAGDVIWYYGFGVKLVKSGPFVINIATNGNFVSAKPSGSQDVNHLYINLDPENQTIKLENLDLRNPEDLEVPPEEVQETLLGYVQNLIEFEKPDELLRNQSRSGQIVEAVAGITECRLGLGFNRQEESEVVSFSAEGTVSRWKRIGE